MKRFASLARLGITVVLLFYVLQQTGIFDAAERAKLFLLIRSVSIPFLVFSLLISILINLASGLKWYLLLRSQGLQAGFFRVWALYMVGIFFSLFLPTSMGGDLIRIYELGRLTGKRAEAAASVFVERFSGMVVLFLLAFVAVLLQRQLFSVTWIAVSLLVAISSSIVIIWVIVDERPYRLVTDWLGCRFCFLSGLLGKMNKLHYAVLAYRDNRRALFIALINTLLFYLLAVVNVYVTALAFSGEVRFLELLIAVPLIMFIMNLPISIGGIGLMEFAFIFIFNVSGYGSALALSTALLMRLKSFVDAGIGGLFYLQLFRDLPLRKEDVSKDCQNMP